MKLLLAFVLGICIVFGLIWLLRYSHNHANRCPNCGTLIANTATVYRNQRDGLFPCPKRGTLVRVDHTPRG